MIRSVNIACIAMTGIVCLGLYNLAEKARVAQAELRVTERTIQREHEALTILGTEWARLTQPARISALAKRHLDLIDRPAIRLSSLTELPEKSLPLPSEGVIRTAKATMPMPMFKPQRAIAVSRPVQSAIAALRATVPLPSFKPQRTIAVAQLQVER